MTSATLRNTIIANPLASEQEAAAFFTTNEWRYMEKRWRPVLPARVWAVLSCLYDHIRFDKVHWEKKEICWPSLGEIAARTRMDERTVRRILHRDAAGRFSYSYRSQIYWIAHEEDVTRYVERQEQIHARHRQQRQSPATTNTDAAATASPRKQKPIVCPVRPGELMAGAVDAIPVGYTGPVFSLGDLIALFIRDVSPRYHYSQVACQWQRTSNAYTVAAIVPPVPDTRSSNDLLISLADVRAARQKLQTEQADPPPPVDIRARTNWPVQGADKLAEKARTLEPSKTTNGVSISTEVGEPATIRNDNAQQPGRNDEDVPSTLSSHIEQETPPAAPRLLGQTSQNDTAPDGEPDLLADLLTPLGGAAVRERPAPVDSIVIEEQPPTLPASAFLSEGEILRIQADAVVGKVIAEVAAQVMRDKNPQSVRAQVVRALVDAQTPLDQLIPALYLGRNRVARFLCAGGTIKKTLAGFFLVTMRNVAKEGRGIGYHFAKQDTVEHVGHVAEGAGDYAYLQTPGYRNSPQRLINPQPDRATRAAQIRASFDLADQNRRAYDER